DYSFYSLPHNVFSRIAMILVPKIFMEYIFSATTGYRLISDHAPVLITWSPSAINESSKRWRLNASLLTDETFQSTLKDEVKTFLEINSKGDQPWHLIWDALKAFVRGILISKATIKKKSRNLLQTQLEEELLNLEKKKKKYKPIPPQILSVFCKKYELNKILTGKIEYALFRTKQYYFESGEKARKLLAHHLKKIASSQIIPMINSPNSLFFSPKDINKAFVSYYKDLYSSQQTSDPLLFKSFFDKITLPHLLTDNDNWLDEPLSLPEIGSAIRSMPSGVGV
uniref:Reverse transcriptase domain-containing protein n=1 Tax=Latimeria chalumnae TaxID=7897 RepID=H3AFP7_LATCH